MFVGLLRSMRPHQWIKNGFVLAPLIFSQELTNLSLALRAALAAMAFIAVSSGVYLLNDCADVDKDRAHPVKRARPIASGVVPVGVALRVAGALAIGAIATAALLSPWLALTLFTYAVLNLAYSLRLKRIPVLDVVIIALGFLLRVIAGAVAIGVPISGWLLGCTFGIATFLGLGKRRHELAVARERAHVQRDALRGYTTRALDIGLALSGVATVAAYTGYAFSAHTTDIFGNPYAPLTVPFIVIGMVRFARLVAREGDAESPTERMMRDPLLVGTVIGWAILVIVLIYR